jgi:hypothetical protein
MEYRKKNLKPKPNLAEEIKESLNNQKLMEQIDFFQ